MNVVAPEAHPVVFELHIQTVRLTALAEMVVRNSFREVEPGAFKLPPPNVLPIGLLTSDCRRTPGASSGLAPSPTGRSCTWRSAASQSSTHASSAPVPFLWVVRPDFTTGAQSKVWFDDI